MTKGSDNGGKPSGASALSIASPPLCFVLPRPTFLFWLMPVPPFSAAKSSMSKSNPQADIRRGSAAPVDVDTIISASRKAFVAAMLDACAFYNALVLESANFPTPC